MSISVSAFSFLQLCNQRVLETEKRMIIDQKGILDAETSMGDG